MINVSMIWTQNLRERKFKGIRFLTNENLTDLSKFLKTNYSNINDIEALIAKGELLKLGTTVDSSVPRNKDQPKILYADSMEEAGMKSLGCNNSFVFDYADKDWYLGFCENQFKL